MGQASATQLPDGFRYLGCSLGVVRLFPTKMVTARATLNELGHAPR